MGAIKMRTTFLKTCGVSIAALGLGVSLAVTPAMAQVGQRHGGSGMGGHGGSFHSGGGMGGRGGIHNGGGMGGHGGGWSRGGMATHGGGWRGGYENGSGYGSGRGYGNGYGYGGAALGLGLLGGAIIGSQYPYYDSNNGYEVGYDNDRQDTDGSYCASRFRSFDPASGTYLGYDGLRHPCP
jgi:hypothetical protein